jgi:hypothetical protein
VDEDQDKGRDDDGWDNDSRVLSTIGRTLGFGWSAMAEDTRFELVRGCLNTLSNCGGGFWTACRAVHLRSSMARSNAVLGSVSRLNGRERS